MITVSLNRDLYAYDIHSLIKAFYPECDVKVFVASEKDYTPGEGEPSFTGTFSEDLQELLLVLSVDGEEKGRITAKAEEAADLSLKNALKQDLYRLLSDFTGEELPWGNLTGIRPTKIPMNLMEEGKGEEEILNRMETFYQVSSEKAALALAIAKREKKVLDLLNYENGYSLYIGIPFCPTTCLYCSFTSYPIGKWKDQVDAYLDALEQEIEYTAKAMRGRTLDSVYMGGGTPSTLSPEQMDRLLKKLAACFDLSTAKEFTVEAGRPDSITRELLKVMHDNGVERISVNPQTMREETLKLIGRHHTVRQTIDAFHMAREVGFEHINMDIILGLPGEGPEDVAYTINEIKKLRPDSLTVHSLAIKRGSRLKDWIESHDIKTLENTDETMAIAAKGAADMGLAPYYLYRQKNMRGNFENVGYAAEGKEGIYNILIMEEVQDIVALGAGSISKRIFPEGRIERCENVKEVALYMERIDEMIRRKQELFGQKA
ncbi:MAG: coproporphyrinogen dehydrogenase HemZ [Lachnospiraceae bacterium]|nr:coproporphyrinogen dehydrogenase HemZ [Lachnospiraceae bacterium]